ncbi:hypothetical protein SLS62_008760 [Diatrype stigma]|uniref:Uncharacterized protein n=1 Tax=Diatrype stigma TaxID=117547 RepID=A0AAN9UHB2_9PEZI
MAFLGSAGEAQRRITITCPSIGMKPAHTRLNIDSGVHVLSSNPDSRYFLKPVPENLCGSTYTNVYADASYHKNAKEDRADSITIDCAIGSESTQGSYGVPNNSTLTGSRGKPDKHLFPRIKCPERITGPSMLSHLFKDQKRNAAGTTEPNPPPGFERPGADTTANAQESEVELPGHNTSPLPELRFLCPSNHASHKQPSRGNEKAQKQKGGSGPVWVRPTQKVSHLHGCVDCTFVPFISNEYVDPDDFILFDELHQLCTF